VATTIGYGSAGVAAAIRSPDLADAWGAFAGMIGSSVLLGAVFIALGYVISVLVRDRGTAGGIAIGVWLLFVIIYDMALLGVLVADQGRLLGPGAVDWLLLLNPADAYRLLNLAATTSVGAFSGMAGLAAQTLLDPGELLAALLVWSAVPLSVATWAFARRAI
jgi:Cu-processing system permease protein